MGNERTILVVDDLEDLRSVTSETLKMAGFNTLEACDGLEAIELLRETENPALILLDWSMPRMNGEEFLFALRNDPQLASIPVILMSAEENLKNIASNANVDGFVGKPSASVEILQIIRNVLKTS